MFFFCCSLTMPRGFLIKRKKHHPEPWVFRRGSDDSGHFSGYGSGSSGGDEALNLSTKNTQRDSAENRDNSSENTSDDRCSNIDNGNSTDQSNGSTQGVDFAMNTSPSPASSLNVESLNSELSSGNTKEDISHEPSPNPESRSPDPELSPSPEPRREEDSAQVNFNKIYLEAARKAQQMVEQEKLNKERLEKETLNKERMSEGEFNNNIIPPIRHPLSDFNRSETFQHYLPSSLPSSAPLSIATGSSWSPFYLTAFDHLSVASSPSGTSSHASSPRSAPIIQAVIPQPSPKPQGPPPGSPPSSSKKRTHPGNKASPQKANNKRVKAIRKIEFNDSSSPVSGTYIREETDDGIRVVSGDIDVNLNIVEVTPEAEAEIAKIENKIGDYKCRLCKDMFESAFTLAQHRCSRIVHVEYRCPECDKVFNCSANLASHRRWHKPRQQQTTTAPKRPLAKLLPNGLQNGEAEDIKEPMEQGQFPCSKCGKHFKRQAYLRKHMATHNNNSPASPEETPCHLCGTMLNSESRAKHMMQHEHMQGIICRLCGARVTDPVALEEHVRHHHQHRADIFSCKLCSTSFYNLTSLSEHVRKCHPSSPPTHPPLVMLQIPTLSRPC